MILSIRSSSLKSLLFVFIFKSIFFMHSLSIFIFLEILVLIRNFLFIMLLFKKKSINCSGVFSFIKEINFS